jgi:hypothetical protein
VKSISDSGIRARGINYDTGFFDGTRESFEPDVVRRELQIIADDLHCTAVRVSGSDPERLSVAGRLALEAGLEVWFAPFPSDMSPDEMVPYFEDCARRAERLRERSPRVVFVAGCEFSIFARGFLPGDGLLDRVAKAVEAGILHGGGDTGAAMEQLNAWLARLNGTVRRHFGGQVTYASGKWEPVDWSLFEIVAVDLYHDAKVADSYLSRLREYKSHGKPVAIVEFGCCTYRGAADAGGTGWMILDDEAEPLRIRGDHVRDEGEQARYMRELLDLYVREGVDSAFWFTFASYEMPHRPDPQFDLDLGAYGVVKVLEDGFGTAYPDMRWEPKESFHTLAEIYSGLRESEPVG